VLAARRRDLTAAALVVAAAVLIEWTVWQPFDLHPRYLIFVVPAFAALAAAAVGRWPAATALVAVAVATMATVDAQHWRSPMLPSRPIARLVARLRGQDERVCALPYARGALMGYTSAPPEVTRTSQLHRCDAVVAIATGPRRLLAQAERRFPDRREFPAITGMYVLTRRPS
jgi:hypothetical protein